MPSVVGKKEECNRAHRAKGGRDETMIVFVPPWADAETIAEDSHAQTHSLDSCSSLSWDRVNQFNTDNVPFDVQSGKLTDLRYRVSISNGYFGHLANTTHGCPYTKIYSS